MLPWRAQEVTPFWSNGDRAGYEELPCWSTTRHFFGPPK